MTDDTRTPRPDQTIQVDAGDLQLDDLPPPRSSRKTPPPLPMMDAPASVSAPPGLAPLGQAAAPPRAPAAAKSAGGRIALFVVFAGLLVAAIAAGLLVGKSVRSKPVAGAAVSGSVSATGAAFSAAIPLSASAKTLEIPMVEVSGP
jgi:hypothetical protein